MECPPTALPNPRIGERIGFHEVLSIESGPDSELALALPAGLGDIDMRTRVALRSYCMINGSPHRPDLGASKVS